MDKLLEQDWAVSRGDSRVVLTLGEFQRNNADKDADKVTGTTALEEQEAQLAAHRHRATKALRQAARKGDIAVLQQLLKEGADVNGAGIDGVTPAWYAAANDHFGVLQVLHMGKGHEATNADLDLAARDGTTPMMAAARNGHDTAIRFLLCEGANWRSQSASHKTALDIAKEFNRSRAKNLLEAAQLCDAATVGGPKGTMEVARLLAATKERGDGGNIRPDGCSETCGAGCSEDCHSGLDHRYHSAMHCAAAGDDALSSGPMEVLLEYGANINVEGAGQPNSSRGSVAKNTPLMAAAYVGNVNAVRFLLKAKADWRLVDSDNKTALDVAFENQQSEACAIIEAFANDERRTCVAITQLPRTRHSGAGCSRAAAPLRPLPPPAVLSGLTSSSAVCSMCSAAL